MQSDIHAKDIMVRDVVTVSPMTTVMQVARTLVDRGLSGLPILGDGGQILGVVTEGDLLRRIETRTERQRSMWSRLFTSNSKLAAEYLKSHARRARDVMTAPVFVVEEYALLGEVAQLMDEQDIKRVPVLRAGKLVGIVSRRDLVRALLHVAESDGHSETMDKMIRDRLLAELHDQPWADITDWNIIVEDGVVQLWGCVASPEARDAIRVAAENTPGVRLVADHMWTPVRPLCRFASS